MKGCACISFNKKKVRHFNLHNSNFALAFYSPQPTAVIEGATSQSWHAGVVGRTEARHEG